MDIVITTRIDECIRAILLNKRGNNYNLIKELLEKISPKEKERLFRVLQEMEMEVTAERNKRKRGQFF